MVSADQFTAAASSGSVVPSGADRCPWDWSIRIQRGAFRVTISASWSASGSRYGLPDRRTEWMTRSILRAVAITARLQPFRSISDLRQLWEPEALRACGSLRALRERRPQVPVALDRPTGAALATALACLPDAVRLVFSADLVLELADGARRVERKPPRRVEDVVALARHDRVDAVATQGFGHLAQVQRRVRNPGRSAT